MLILEAAPEAFRGGNSRHTRNVRYMHDGESNYLTGVYSEEEFYGDLLQVTGGKTNEALARLTIRESADLGVWMTENGIRWQGPLRGTLQLSRTNAFFLGGGKALVNTYYETARKLGIEAAYDSEVCDIVGADDGSWAVSVEHDGRREAIDATAIVLASGGFEANLDWLAEYWGAAAQNFAIRGTRFNRGGPLRTLLDQGAQAVGDPREYHAIAVDARGPQFDGGIVTRLDSIPFGIVVNKEGQRFSDEGSDFWPKRYASWGGLIARQPEQVAYSIVDAKKMRDFMPSLFPPIRSDSVRELASTLKLDPEVLEGTVADFNAAVRAGTYGPTALDDCRTEGLEPAKSHWALPLDEAAILRLSVAAGDHLYLSRLEGEREGSGARRRRRGADWRFRRRRDHGRQHPRPGLPRRLRHDDRDGVRPDRRQGGGEACPPLTFSMRSTAS